MRPLWPPSRRGGHKGRIYGASRRSLDRDRGDWHSEPRTCDITMGEPLGPRQEAGKEEACANQDAG
jgi:hypothetical protein